MARPIRRFLVKKLSVIALLVVFSAARDGFVAKVVKRVSHGKRAMGKGKGLALTPGFAHCAFDFSDKDGDNFRKDGCQRKHKSQWKENGQGYYKGSAPERGVADASNHGLMLRACLA